MEMEVLQGVAAGWKNLPAARGFGFNDKTGTPDGLTRVWLKTTASSTAPRLSATGRGPNLPIPAMPVSFPISVQWQVSNGVVQQCWDTTFTTAGRNDARKFRAKVP